MNRSIAAQIEGLAQRRGEFGAPLNDHLDSVRDALRLLTQQVLNGKMLQGSATAILNNSGVILPRGTIVGYSNTLIAKSLAAVEGAGYVPPIFIVPTLTAPAAIFRPVADEIQRVVITGACLPGDPLWLSASVAGSAQTTRPTATNVIQILVGVAASEVDSTGTALMRRDPSLSPALSFG